MPSPDRRRHGRHTFPLFERPRVELRCLLTGPRRPPLGAAVVDLSAGGMGLLLDAEPDLVELLLPWSARLALDAAGAPAALELDCEAVHRYGLLGRPVYGFRFRGAAWLALEQFLRERAADARRAGLLPRAG